MITGLRRSSLYVPGDNQRMIEKAAALPADMLLLNLEDGVAPWSKAEARDRVARALTSIDFGSREIAVRVNGGETGQEDLEALAPRLPDGIVLPKVESAAEIRNADAALLGIETRHGIPGGTIRLHAMIESASGVLRAAEIASASPRMSSLIFGSADYTKDLDCRPGADREELSFALQMVVTAARAGRIDAIDAPCFDIRDSALLRREAAHARRLGYCGKSAIHPNQIEEINLAFDVTADEIAWAKSVLAELKEAERRGKSISTMEGRLIEDPHRIAAERILRRRDASRKT